MTVENFKKICRICDDLLFSKNASSTRVAINWLHIIRGHPEFIKEYKSIFSSKTIYRRVFESLHSFRTVLKGAIFFFRAVLIKSDYSISTLQKRLKSVDYIFISHIVNGSQAGLRNDFYFGQLPLLLSEKGKSVLVVLLNHTAIESQTLASNWNGSRVPRIVLSKGIPAIKAIRMYFRMCSEFIQLRFYTKKANDIIKSRVIKRASIEALSSGTFFNLMLEKQIAGIITSYKPTNLVVSYEGHAFERMAFYGARHVKSDIACMGYQHSALFKLQHAFKRMLIDVYNPQIILTSSLMAKNMLKSDLRFRNILIESIGSNRAIQKVGLKSDTKSQKRCLVLPEGFMSECVLLFNFSLECAKLNPELIFIWRIHPIMTFSQIIKTNSHYNELPKNIFLSDKELDEDILRCHFALYRGSTAIIKAVAAGIKPAYYKKTEEEMTIDPLYRINEGKIILTAPAEFNDLLVENKNYKGDSQKIIQFCQRYYDAIDPTFLLNFDKA